MRLVVLLARTWLDSVPIVAARRDSSSHSSPLAANAHACRTGRHLTRHCFRFVDSRDSQRIATGSVYGEPGGGTLRRPGTLSSQRSRSAGPEVSSATEELPSCLTQQVADDRCQ